MTFDLLENHFVILGDYISIQHNLIVHAYFNYYPTDVCHPLQITDVWISKTSAARLQFLYKSIKKASAIKGLHALFSFQLTPDMHYDIDIK